MTVAIVAVGHVGIRVHDLDRALAFYGQLGFTQVWWGEEDRVSVLRHPAGMEINLIVNAVADGPNVLMDVPKKVAGITHVAWSVQSVDAAAAALLVSGHVITEGPVTHGNGSRSVFVRDPDHNVVEFCQPAPS
jgi:lactoylglutathione lyase